jgi:hypothetical protein
LSKFMPFPAMFWSGLQVAKADSEVTPGLSHR